MLSNSDNELLTRTGPGTPMGNLLRRFWLPALLPSELPQPDCPPIRFRVLGEDLVAFRDSSGTVGFVANACPHRGASMFFGRNEENGLRCVYHGWKFDVTGTCVDMPSEPPESNFKSKVTIRAYPSAEWGGIVWIYMGPPEKKPDLPEYEWCMNPDLSDLHAYKWMQESNYAQGLEGNIDTAHVGFLHGGRGPLQAPRPGARNTTENPLVQVKETEFGFVYGGRRETPDGQYYWRVTPFIMPMASIIPGGDEPIFFVYPMDDEHTWWWRITPQAPRGLDGRPYVDLIPGTWRQTANSDNDYMLDREMQKYENYTGLVGNRVQDGAVTESMGVIYDRSREHLGTTDAAIIFMRRYLIKMARQLEQGIEPEMVQHPDWFRVRTINLYTEEPNLEPLYSADRAAHRAAIEVATVAVRE